MFLITSAALIIWVCFWIASCYELRQGLKEIREGHLLAGQNDARLSFSLWYIMWLFFIWPLLYCYQKGEER